MPFYEKKLFQTVSSGNGTDLKDFLDHGLSVNYAFHSDHGSGFGGKTLLFVAVSKGHHHLARLLVDQGCDPDLTHILAWEGNKPTLRKIEGNQCLKQTPLYQCLVREDAEMTRILVSGGCDVNIPDKRGSTPMWYAVDMGNYPIAKALLSRHSCDVNKYDATHLYPLHVAALHSNVKMASLLIRHNARIDVPSIRGYTPLILACWSASYDLVRLLLLNGADPNHLSINGHTPISAVLETCSDRKILNIIVEAGARIDLAGVEKCVKDKLLLLKSCPAVLDLLKQLAAQPSSLKMLCCLAVRKSLLSSKCDQHLDLKVQQLPLPNTIKDFLLLSHL